MTTNDTSTSFSPRLNGLAQALEVDSRLTHLDVLREHLDLTGTKKGCDHGQRGACTVLIDGRRANRLDRLLPGVHAAHGGRAEATKEF